MPLYEEQKLSVTLSSEAQKTIESDMSIFDCSSTWSGFINRIVLNYKNETNASIKVASKNMRNQIAYVLHPDDGKTSSAEDIIINKIVDDYSKKLRNEMRSFSSGAETKKIRMQDKNKDVLAPLDKSEYLNKGDYANAGSFVKAILEDYARQPFNRREEIIFKERIRDIAICKIDDYNRYILKIDYKNRNGVPASFKLKPYGLMTDKLTGYQYCVGFLFDSDAKINTPFSLRIYRMIDSKPLSQRAHISKKDEKDLKDSILHKGLAYLQGDSEIIKIALTSAGEKKYRSVLHLRPMHINTEFKLDFNGNRIYEFNCTFEQIRNYFFQFGKEAIVIEPSELKEEFYNRYNEASINYSNSISYQE